MQLKFKPNSQSRLSIVLLASLLVFAARLQALDIGHDAAGRVIWSSQPNGQTTTFGYDTNGNIKSIVSITPAYDALDRVTSSPIVRAIPSATTMTVATT